MPPEENRVARRWTPPLARQFCPVPSAFLRLYRHLRPSPGARGLNSTEALLIIQAMDFKWDEKLPFPSVETLAQRMGLSTRMVRKSFAYLESCGYVVREPVPGRSNRYRLDGLFAALEKLLAQTAAVKESA